MLLGEAVSRLWTSCLLIRRQTFATLLVGGVVVAAAGSADATVLYSQPLNLNGDGGPFSYSNQQVADAFQLSTAASVDGLTWYGDNLGNSFPATLTFTINLYADAFGMPASVTFASESVTATVTDTGIISGGEEIFAFATTLPSSVVLAGSTTYWLSILDPRSFTPDPAIIFRWAPGSTTWPADLNNEFGSPPPPWNISGDTRAQAAYTLLTATPVPEPTSVGILGAGLLGLAARRRRAA